MPPRSIFNATITFGLVNVPIKLHTATDNKTICFREVHETDGAPLEHRRLDPETGDVVSYDDIVKGFEIAEGEYVVLTKEEVKAAAGERTKTIPIEEFVPAADIDPVYFAKTYYVGPREGGEAAYKALQTALEETGRAGIGRMTFHDREYLVAVRALDDVLALHQLRFADEVAGEDELELATPGRGPTEREVKMAGSLVESLADRLHAGRVRGHLPRARGGDDRGEGEGQADRPPRGGRARRGVRPVGRPRGVPERDEEVDAPLDVDRLARASAWSTCP